MSTPSRNEPCRCGSGKKYKKCCGAPGAATANALPHTQADRAAAFEQLEFFVEELWGEEEDEAFELFWGRYFEREGELPTEFVSMSNDVEEIWFAFDHEVDAGVRVVDEFLKQAPLGRGQRSFLEAMRASSMRLYEVLETVPGVSITLRDLVEGEGVTVAERTASRQLVRHECIAARVLSRGCSGRPELERGLLRIPALISAGLVNAVQEERRQYFAERPGASLVEFYKSLPALYHDAWLTCFFDPPVPRLANTDGEETVLTVISFDVRDKAELVRALDAAEGRGIERRGDVAWGWSGPNRAGEVVSLGALRLASGRLRVEVNSVERGTRIRTLLEELAGEVLGHHGTTHEDMRRKVKEAASARALGKSEDVVLPRTELDPELAEALVAEHYARHYRAWVDEPVPALDGQAPRAAAKGGVLRARVEDLLRGLEGMYEEALKAGEPAYDPSWMWEELGLREAPDLSNPPPLAHERVGERVPGSAAASRAAAERFRAQPGFDDASMVLDEEALRGDLELQRFLRRERNADNDAGSEPGLAAPFIPLMVNLDLHRRKLFWVEAALSYMLESTDLDVTGRELRTPFPSFALVFTDRHALSLGERLLSRRAGDPLAGQMLRVLTVYISARSAASGRVLDVTMAFDALGADLPSLVRYEVPADDEASLRDSLEALGPRPSSVGAELRDRNPARGLLRLVLNAILYATSAGVTAEVRTVTPRLRSLAPAAPPPDSDAIFFLPGKIDIRMVRQLEELARAPGGQEQLARFMVRGHWRRPAKNWAEQRLRWIEPYWKGPDLAAIIEKEYRLKV